MRTLDVLERKWGFGIAAIPLVIALVLLPRVLHNTPGTASTKFVLHHCLPAHHVGALCVVPVIFTPAHYALEFGLLVFMGAVLLLGVWRSMRVLVAVASIFAGLATGFVGLVPIFYGAWLLLRSWRLQRYGVTDGASVRKVVAERSKEKREAKKAPAPAGDPGARPVTQSKRYTPKAKPRKR
jgi:hypothetical protein